MTHTSVKAKATPIDKQETTPTDQPADGDITEPLKSIHTSDDDVKRSDVGIESTDGAQQTPSSLTASTEPTAEVSGNIFVKKLQQNYLMRQQHADLH